MTPAFREQVIIVTGAASGIGLATATLLASLGARLALCDRNEEWLSLALRRLENVSEAHRHSISVVDVGNSLAVNDFVNKTVEVHGRINHVFNCAGVNPTPQPLESTPDEYWDKIINTNLRGTFNLSRAAIPHLEAAGRGSIVNVSSILGTRGSAENAVYCASKFGVIGFTKALALELGPKGIRVNCVAPGFIHTPTNMDVVKGQDAIQQAASQVALGRLGDPAEIAEAVAYLMGTEARYVTGSVLEINGGLL